MMIKSGIINLEALENIVGMRIFGLGDILIEVHNTDGLISGLIWKLHASSITGDNMDDKFILIWHGDQKDSPYVNNVAYSGEIFTVTTNRRVIYSNSWEL